jgi:hypothetical protein
MDDMVLVSVGRQFIEFCLQREQLLRQVESGKEALKQLEEKLAKLESKAE